MLKQSIFIFFLLLILLGGSSYALHLHETNVTHLKEDFIYFTQEGCQYCPQVETFLEKKDLDHVSFTVTQNLDLEQEGNALFLDATERCSISPEEIGVPLIWNTQEKTCIVGTDTEVINNLEKFLN